MIKKSHATSKTTDVLKALKSVIQTKDKRFLLASIVLHIVLVSLLLVSWQHADPVKITSIPDNVKARVINSEEIQALKTKKENEQKKIIDEKRAREKKKLQEKKQKELKRKKDLAKKKAEAKRKADAKKKALIKKEQQKKQKQEQERLEKQRVAQIKKNEEQKKADQKKREERERRLLEKMQQAEAQLEKQLEAERMAEELSRQQALQMAQELSETERFLSLIRSRIENRWHIPPKSKGLNVVLQIKLLPTGELSDVRVVQKSGVTAFDQSAVSAVRSVRVFPVPENRVLFEKQFRTFSMRFAPL